MKAEHRKRYQDFYNYLLEKDSSSSTAEGHVHRVHHFLSWAEGENLTADTIRSADILHYLQGFKKLVKQRTLYGKVNSIRHYFDYLKAKEQVGDNPATYIQIKGIRRRSLYHILSRQELDSLYDTFEIPAEEDPRMKQNWYQRSVLTGKRNKVVVGLLVFQGLTSEELARVVEKDIKLREGKIYIAGGRKSNERELKLEAHQILDLMEYVLKIRPELQKLTGKAGEKLFESAAEGASFHNVLSGIMKKLRQQNSKVRSVKQIRASVITHWLKNHNLREAQYKAGHRYVSSTEAYLINDLEDLSEQISKYHPIG